MGDSFLGSVGNFFSFEIIWGHLDFWFVGYFEEFGLVVGSRFFGDHKEISKFTPLNRLNYCDMAFTFSNFDILGLRSILICSRPAFPRSGVHTTQDYFLITQCFWQETLESRIVSLKTKVGLELKSSRNKKFILSWLFLPFSPACFNGLIS